MTSGSIVDLRRQSVGDSSAIPSEAEVPIVAFHRCFALAVPILWPTTKDLPGVSLAPVQQPTDNNERFEN